MQIQKQNQGLQALLMQLLPLMGQTAGGAMGGPAGSALGGVAGAGLEGILSPNNQEAQMLGGQQGMQQISSNEGNGPMQSVIKYLMEQLRSSPMQQQPQQEEKKEEAPVDMQKRFEEILNKMSGNGKELMFKYLRSMATRELANRGQ